MNRYICRTQLQEDSWEVQLAREGEASTEDTMLLLDDVVRDLTRLASWMRMLRGDDSLRNDAIEDCARMLETRTKLLSSMVDDRTLDAVDANGNVTR